MDWTPELTSRAQALYDSGKIPREVAKILTRTQGTPVTFSEVRANIRVHREHHVPPKVRAEIQWAYQTETTSRADIAARFGVRPTAVTRICGGLKRPNAHQVPRGTNNPALVDGRAVITMREPIVVEVPHWVPVRLHNLYIALAERDCEQSAASVVRMLKHGATVQEAFR